VGDLGPGTWALLLVAAGLVGFAKTAIGGVASLAVVIFAFVLPPRESTGALLPLLICGDVLAVGYYRRHARWGTLWRLFPGVVPGLLLGAWFVATVDEVWMRRSIGLILLALCGMQLWTRSADRPTATGARGAHPMLAVLIGAVAGFTTMTANAAGPVMTLYLILAGLPMLELIGTGAWFFAVVNLVKLPFSLGLGLVSPGSLIVDALLVPALLVGGLVGILAIRRMDQRTFETAALALSGASAALLLL
jgi:uncharacterized membrane protein YfcA